MLQIVIQETPRLESWRSSDAELKRLHVKWFLDYFHLFLNSTRVIIRCNPPPPAQWLSQTTDTECHEKEKEKVLINPVAGWNWRDGDLDWLVDLFLSKESNFSFDKKQFSSWQVRKDPVHSDFHCHHRSGHFWYRSLVRLQLPHDVAGRLQGRTGKKILVFAVLFFLFQCSACSIVRYLQCS